MSAGMPDGGLEDRIGMGDRVRSTVPLWGPCENPERLIVLVPAHLGRTGKML